MTREDVAQARRDLAGNWNDLNNHIVEDYRLNTAYCSPSGCPPPKGYVKLSRKIGVGERVKLPDGCEVEAEGTGR